MDVKQDKQEMMDAIFLLLEERYGVGLVHRIDSNSLLIRIKSHHDFVVHVREVSE